MLDQPIRNLKNQRRVLAHQHPRGVHEAIEILLNNVEQ